MYGRRKEWCKKSRKGYGVHKIKLNSPPMTRQDLFIFIVFQFSRGSPWKALHGQRCAWLLPPISPPSSFNYFNMTDDEDDDDDHDDHGDDDDDHMANLTIFFKIHLNRFQIAILNSWNSSTPSLIRSKERSLNSKTISVGLSLFPRTKILLFFHLHKANHPYQREKTSS